jgi:hypothetical protein
MGWLRWMLLGDLGQQMDISDHQAEIDRLRGQVQARHVETSTIDDRVRLLQRENDELKLYLVAVVRLLIAKKVATTEEIQALVDRLDREDGIPDRKYGGDMLPK